MNQAFALFKKLTSQFSAPKWLVDESQQRLVLLLNHVLMQEKQAQERLRRKAGQVVHLRWNVWKIDLVVTQAGLADLALPSQKPDLTLRVTQDAPWVLAQSLLAGKTPAVSIEGDVQLAAELGWLAENLRWDVADDLSRLVGDVPAHTMMQTAKNLAAGLRDFLKKVVPMNPAESDRPAQPTKADS